MKAAIMSKQYGNDSFLTPLIADACGNFINNIFLKKLFNQLLIISVSIIPGNTTFNVDNIRVCKILGGSFYQSQVVQGMVFKRVVEGEVAKVEGAKIAVFTCPVDSVQTETKGTVLIQSSAELMDFSRGEENMLEKEIAAIAATGAKVVVSGGKIGDLCLHYLNKYGLMAVRLQSKFDLRRLCKTVNATALPRLTAPSAEELGYADRVYTDEFGDTAVVVFRQDGRESRVATVVIRGATDNFLDDVERAIDDGVNNFKALSREARLVPGAGATEAELSRLIGQYADKCPGLDQYAIQRFARALESMPRLLADNAGLKSTQVLADLTAAHQEGKVHMGVNVEVFHLVFVCDIFLFIFLY
jgi:T-complex protein 1 subunit theta